MVVGAVVGDVCGGTCRIFVREESDFRLPEYDYSRMMGGRCCGWVSYVCFDVVWCGCPGVRGVGDVWGVFRFRV